MFSENTFLNKRLTPIDRQIFNEEKRTEKGSKYQYSR